MEGIKAISRFHLSPPLLVSPEGGMLAIVPSRMSAPSLEPEDLLPVEERGLRVGVGATLSEVHDELFAYLCRRVADREAAADLTQEALLRLVKYRDGPQAEDRRWLLFRIARNLVLEYRRTQSRRHADQHISLDDVVPLRMESPAMEVMADTHQLLEQLFTHTLVNLPSKCRLAFLLNRLHGLTYPQVAARMRISVKMVEKHITRALAACRLAIGDREL